MQVKVTACDQHLIALEEFVEAVNATDDRLDGPGIGQDMIFAARLNSFPIGENKK